MEKVFSTLAMRSKEIDDYLAFIDKLDKANIANSPLVEASQYHVIIATTYLLIYSMVESVMTMCIQSLSEHIFNNRENHPEYSEEVLKFLISHILNVNNNNLSVDKKMDKGLKLYSIARKVETIAEPFIDKNKGGNWGYKSIIKFSKSLGIDIKKKVNDEILKGINPKHKQNLLDKVKDTRNELSHGVVSFSRHGKEVAINDIKDCSNNIKAFLGALVTIFNDFIEKKQFFKTVESP